MTKHSLIYQLAAYFLIGMLVVANMLIFIPLTFSAPGTLISLFGGVILASNIGVLIYSLYCISACLCDISKLNAENKE